MEAHCRDPAIPLRKSGEKSPPIPRLAAVCELDTMAGRGEAPDSSPARPENEEMTMAKRVDYYYHRKG